MPAIFFMYNSNNIRMFGMILISNFTSFILTTIIDN